MIECDVVSIFRRFLHVDISAVCKGTILKSESVGVPCCAPIRPRNRPAVVTVMRIGEIPEIRVNDASAKMLARRFYSSTAIAYALVINDAALHV